MGRQTIDIEGGHNQTMSKDTTILRLCVSLSQSNRIRGRHYPNLSVNNL